MQYCLYVASIIFLCDVSMTCKTTSHSDNGCKISINVVPLFLYHVNWYSLLFVVRFVVRSQIKKYLSYLFVFKYSGRHTATLVGAAFFFYCLTVYIL